MKQERCNRAAGDEQALVPHTDQQLWSKSQQREAQMVLIDAAWTAANHAAAQTQHNLLSQAGCCA